jgi:glycosyltransferase involved in cell wall biosynthesis
MKTLGVSMIVKDEEFDIEKCLESIKDADEIIILDTGSEDSTVEICKRYTENVFTDYMWKDDFAEARNVSLSRCTADWILIIDADEQLDCDIKGIKHLINSGFMNKYEGMTFVVKTQAEIVQSIRIIKNIPEIKWHSAVHNVLTLNGSNAELVPKCYVTKFEIKSGYSAAHFKDPNRSLRILTKQLEIDPENTRYMYYIAREFISRRMDPVNKDQVPELLDKIIYWLEGCDVIAFEQDWTNELADALYCLSLAYFEKCIITQDYKWWYKGITAASKAFLVLPSYQAVAKLLADAMLELPRKQKYPAAHEFWKFVESKCSNAGVAQIRQLPKN